MLYYQLKNSSEKLAIGKIICLAQTYAKHAQEMKSQPSSEPVLFLKPRSSVIFNNEPIVLPPQSRSVHHEVELGVVIAKTGSNIKESETKEYIYGYLLGLDITARDLQSAAKKQGHPWAIPKGFNTFCPLSIVIPASEISDPHSLILSLKVNGETRQHASTKQLLFSISEILSYISWIMTLELGDLILTGTPEGVAEIKKDDIVEASLSDHCYIKHKVTR